MVACGVLAANADFLRARLGADPVSMSSDLLAVDSATGATRNGRASAVLPRSQRLGAEHWAYSPFEFCEYSLHCPGGRYHWCSLIWVEHFFNTLCMVTAQPKFVWRRLE